MSLEAVIFDFDGLILDTEAAQFTIWSRIFQEHGATLAFDRWIVCIGTSGNYDPASHLEELSGGAVDRAAVLARARGDEASHIRALPVMAGVLDRLEEATTLGIKTAIASSSQIDWVQGHLGHRGMVDRFQVISVRHAGVRAKPAPDIYLAALKELEVPAGNAVAFEDSMNGIAAARDAGVYCIAVPNTMTAGMDLSRANRRVDSLAQVSLAELGRTVFNGGGRG